MKYNWKKHVKSSKKINIKRLRREVTNKLLDISSRENKHLRQQNADLRDLIGYIEIKLRE
jgi:hypothetical protein